MIVVDPHDGHAFGTSTNKPTIDVEAAVAPPNISSWRGRDGM